MKAIKTLAGGVLGGLGGGLLIAGLPEPEWSEVFRFGVMIGGLFAGTFWGAIVADRRLGAGEAGAVGGGVLGFLVGYLVSVLPPAWFPLGFVAAAVLVGMGIGGAIGRRRA